MRAVRKVAEKEVLQAICDCGCGSADAPPQVPRLNRYQALPPWRHGVLGYYLS